MRVGHYWPTLFKDDHSYAKKCQAFRDQKSIAPLLQVIVEEPFQQWGLDVIGEIFP